MRDPDYDPDGDAVFECFDCGTIVEAETNPEPCPDCGSDMRNRSMPIE